MSRGGGDGAAVRGGVRWRPRGRAGGLDNDDHDIEHNDDNLGDGNRDVDDGRTAHHQGAGDHDGDGT